MRFPLLLLALMAARAWAALEPIPVEQARPDGSLLYYDLTSVTLEGRGWSDTPSPYDRLPAKAETTVPGPVWNLSHRSAGICARFITDASELTVRWTLTSPNLDMPHMPSTGVSGIDLYVRTPEEGWRWVANGQPKAQTNSAALFKNLPAEPREFCLYLPLYNGVHSVELGLPTDSRLFHAPPRPDPKAKPLLFYGTSITMGGCASRPGMVHTAIVGRALDRPVINLGFSGNGRMEMALAELLAELNPAIYILDCLPNMNGAMVAERVVPFVKHLHQARPHIPILLVEDRFYADNFMNPSRARRNEENHAALRAAFAQLKEDGITGLHYLPGDRLLGRDGEDTVDGSHPTDLGFARQAEAFLKVLRPILDETSTTQP